MAGGKIVAGAQAQSKTVMQRFLDGIERVGNMVPHPVIIFLILIAIVIVLSAVLAGFGASVSFERINPVTNEIEIATTGIRSLLNADGIRFMYESLVPNFMGFTAVGLMVAAMIGAGVAEAPHQAVRVRGVPGPRARVAAAGAPSTPPTLSCADLVLDPATHNVTRASRKIEPSYEMEGTEAEY